MEASIERPDWLSTDAWPWPVRTVATPAGRIAVTEAGTGPILLLVHAGSWSFIWRDLIRELADDFRVVAFDTPGTGLSERLPWRQASLTQAAQAMTALVDALAFGRFTLVVHNLGGPVGVAAVAGMPERVDGIVAVNTFAWRQASRIFRSAVALIGCGPMRELDVITGLIPRLTASRFAAGRCWRPADRRTFRRGLDAAAIRTTHRYVQDAGPGNDLYDLVEDAIRGPLAERPLLTIFGRWSDFYLHFQPRWHALFPAAVQRVLPKGVGNHFPMGDDPRQVAAWIRDWHATAVASRPSGTGSRAGR
jgi:pimeloyl-ACP methyl ester carboxylesterase